MSIFRADSVDVLNERRPLGRRSYWYVGGLIAMSVTYVVAGSLHCLRPDVYIKIMPSYLSHPRELVLISGAAEIAGGFGVLLPQTRRAAGWGLVVLLIAVMPANMTMLQRHDSFPQIPLWAMWLRLPLQLPLIAWAWAYTRRR